MAPADVCCFNSSPEGQGLRGIGLYDEFKDTYEFPELYPSPAIIEKAAEMQEPFLTFDAHKGESASQLVEKTCVKFHATLQELQATFLPSSLGLSCAHPFMSTEEMFELLRINPSASDCKGSFGQKAGLKVSGTCKGFVLDNRITSVRWVVLLDGTVLAKLMSAPDLTLMDIWAEEENQLETALQGIRDVKWTPELSWAFPVEYNRRVYFLLLVARRFGMSAVWKKYMLPFMACCALDEMRAAKSELFRVGECCDYYSKTNKGWMPARVTARKPVEQEIKVDVKPDMWLTLSEQKQLVRKSQ